MADHLEKIEEAAAGVALAKLVLHLRVLEARSPDLFGGRYSLRDIAKAAGVHHETIRVMAETPIETVLKRLGRLLELIPTDQLAIELERRNA